MSDNLDAPKHGQTNKRQQLAYMCGKGSNDAHYFRGKGKVDHSADYFSHSNAEANLAREKLAEESLESLIEWLKQGGNVGIMGGFPIEFVKELMVCIAQTLRIVPSSEGAQQREVLH